MNYQTFLKDINATEVLVPMVCWKTNNKETIIITNFKDINDKNVDQEDHRHNLEVLF